MAREKPKKLPGPRIDIDEEFPDEYLTADELRTILLGERSASFRAGNAFTALTVITLLWMIILYLVKITFFV